MKKALISKLEKYEKTNKIINDKRYRTITMAVCSLVINMIYAFYNGFLGILSSSVWLTASCVYYLLLALMRFSALINEKNKKNASTYIGIMLIILSVVLSAVLYISLKQDVAASYGSITMITIATYTFTKLILAIVKAVKHRKDKTSFYRAVRNIRYAEIAVSVCTMQRSMLVSFGEMGAIESKILNMFTSISVCIFILTLGVILMKSKKES